MGLGENAAVAACQAGVSKETGHACFFLKKKKFENFASFASSAVSCVRSYAEVASAACDDATALHDSSLCSGR